MTLLTAFGIAGVKAYMVAKHFMHVNHVPRFIPYLMITCLVFMLLFVAGTAPDVYRDSGDNWFQAGCRVAVHATYTRGPRRVRSPLSHAGRNGHSVGKSSGRCRGQ